MQSDTTFPTPPWPWLVAGPSRPEPMYARAPLAPATAAARDRILGVLRGRPWATALVLTRELHMAPSAVYRHLRALARDRTIVHIGRGQWAMAADAGGAT